MESCKDCATLLARLDQAVRALDLLGIALAGHNHQWTIEERKAYETATGNP